MRRRDFIRLLGGAAVAWPLVTRAQQPEKIPRIGILAIGAPSTYVSRYEAFRRGLREFGYVEGQNIAIEYRYGEGKYERLPALAAELIRLEVNVIVVSSTAETDAAKRATASIPIVFALAGDALATGLVASLARPGGNITGMAGGVGPGFIAKQLQLLKEAFPHISRVAVLQNPASLMAPLRWQEAQEVAPALGLALRLHEVRTSDDVAAAFAAMTKERPDALLLLPDPLLLDHRASIAAFAARKRLPAITGIREYGEAGLLMVYGLNVADNYRRAAGYVAKILQGAKPADLPVQQPAKFELIVNLKTAKAIGLKIPESFLLRADEVIE
jgi:putative ABC transport system substrate-binding protein